MNDSAPKASASVFTFPMIVSALLIIGAIAYVAISYKNGLKPSPQSNNATPTPTETSAQVTPTTTKAPIEDKTVVTENPAVMQYISEELGITFSYMKANTVVKRTGNTVYIAPTTMKITDGQYVEVFAKEKDQTLQNSIEKYFLNGFKSTDCFVSVSAKATLYPVGYEAKTISTPPSADIEEMEKKVALCPKGYTQSNGIAYFLASNIRADKFVYISVGQYQIDGTSTQKGWHETVRFIAN